METEQPFGEHARRATRAYSAAADHYTLAALGFWDRFGAATVSRLRLAPGMSVLDLCCGAGASATPAAHAVGAAGRVLGIDVAAPLLKLAEGRAAREGLSNIEFRQGDATQTGLPAGSVDAVLCVFGVFFAQDMTAFVQHMWRLVRPGGVLAVTTWGPGLFEPANSCFWRYVGAVEPSLYKNFNPWDEITTPAALAELFTRAGVPQPVVAAAEARHHLNSPDSFWDIVLGSGYRATVDALRPDQHERIRESVLAELLLQMRLGALRRAACLSEKRSGTLNLRDDDRSLVPPGDTGSPRSGGPARASPTQSRTAAPPICGGRTPQLAACREKVSRKGAAGGIGRPATTLRASAVFGWAFGAAG